MKGPVTLGCDLPPSLDRLLAEAERAENGAQRDVARACYETILHRLKARTYAPVASTLLRWIGWTYVEDGEMEAGLDCLEAALAAATAADDRAARAYAINLMAIAYQYLGQIDRAEECYETARELAIEAEQMRLTAMIEQNLGIIATIRGDFRLALRRYRASLDGYRELDIDAYLGRLFNNIGMLLTDLERWRPAERFYVKALEAARSTGDRGAEIMIEINRAEMWIGRRDYERARDACSRALDLVYRTDDPRVLGEAHKHYGVICRETGDMARAEHHFRRALQIANSRADRLLAAETTREQAELYWRQQRNRETLQCLNRAHQMFRNLRARRDMADVDRKIHDLETMFLGIVQRWGASIENKDRYTQGHSVRVAEYACTLARALGMDPSTLLWFRMGALLHDVGKIVVPADVLNKPGRLTEEEFEIIRRHPAAGVELLGDIEFPWDIRPMVRHHHERWDGTGYPAGLRERDIPLSARILCVADVYDALTTERSYRRAFTHDHAMDIMRQDRGKGFDPDLLVTFEDVVDEVVERRDRGETVKPVPAHGAGRDH